MGSGNVRCQTRGKGRLIIGSEKLKGVLSSWEYLKCNGMRILRGYFYFCMEHVTAVGLLNVAPR